MVGASVSKYKAKESRLANYNRSPSLDVPPKNSKTHLEYCISDVLDKSGPPLFVYGQHFESRKGQTNGKRVLRSCYTKNNARRGEL